MGQLVVLRTLWNLQSHRLGVVVEQSDQDDRFVVMWTTKDGIELKTHLKHSLMPVSDRTTDKIKERNCVFK